MRKMIKPHRVRKTPYTISLAQYENGKDDNEDFGQTRSNAIQFWRNGNIRNIYNTLIANNVPRNRALGVLGNIALESGGRHDIDNGSYSGILQNQSSIRDYIMQNYGDYGYDSQMAYLIDGLHHRLNTKSNIGKQLQNRFNEYVKYTPEGTTPKDAAKIFEKSYERSNQAIQNRQEYADMYDYIIPKNYSVVDTPSGYGNIVNYNEDGSVRVQSPDGMIRTYNSLELPEVEITTNRYPYDSLFDGSAINILNTLGSMFGINFNKGKDSGIHIKKANRGKFTAAAKRAGMGVQAYARKILSAPKGKYSSTLRKRANFAANAAKWGK